MNSYSYLHLHLLLYGTLETRWNDITFALLRRLAQKYSSSVMGLISARL
jgi:hypothetical protein